MESMHCPVLRRTLSIELRDDRTHGPDDIKALLLLNAHFLVGCVLVLDRDQFRIALFQDLALTPRAMEHDRQRDLALVRLGPA